MLWPQIASLRHFKCCCHWTQQTLAASSLKSKIFKKSVRDTGHLNYHECRVCTIDLNYLLDCGVDQEILISNLYLSNPTTDRCLPQRTGPIFIASPKRQLSKNCVNVHRSYSKSAQERTIAVEISLEFHIPINNTI